MIYIDKKTNPSGAYPNPKGEPFTDCIALNDEQAAIFFEYNGFVTVTTDPVTVKPNLEQWNAFKADQEAAEAISSVTAEIEQLKAELAATDYQIIKCSEAQMAGEELPYDIVELHATRQALRDKINELEAI